MFRNNQTRVMWAVILLACLGLSDVFSTAPDAPDAGAMPCRDGACVQLEYWWTNGDNNSPQCRDMGNPAALTTHGKTNVKTDVAVAGQLTTPGPTVTRYNPSKTKRICTGAANGNLEKTIPRTGNVNSSTAETEQRTICGGEQ